MRNVRDQRWPIGPQHRQIVVQRLIKIIGDPASSKREVTAAAKALIAAEGMNQTDDRLRLIDAAVLQRLIEDDPTFVHGSVFAAARRVGVIDAPVIPIGNHRAPTPATDAVDDEHDHDTDDAAH